MSTHQLIRHLRRLSRDPLAITTGGLLALAATVFIGLALSGPPARMVEDGTGVVIALSQGGQETASRALPPRAALDKDPVSEPPAASSEAGDVPAPEALEPSIPPPDEKPETGAAVPESPISPPASRQTTTPAIPPEHEGPPAPSDDDEAAVIPPPELPIPPGVSRDVMTAAEQPGPARPSKRTGKDSAAAALEPPAANPSPPLQATAEDTEPSSVRSSARPGSIRGLTAPEPDPELLEMSRFGPLPRVSMNGRMPWQAYARPFDTSDKRPRISIIVSQLGFLSASTESAISQLPAAVTLSFAPNARGLGNWIGMARSAGHEVLIELPMEPVDFPAIDPGPDTLLTSLTTEENRTRLRTLLGRVSGYVGVVNQMGSRFTTSEPHLRPMFKELR
ncbi:MAG: divergent polysaccharide deacetylase family protein, partial [Alphaproteobacteria bacterium]